MKMINMFTKQQMFVIFYFTGLWITSSCIKIADFNKNEPDEIAKKFFSYFRQPDPRGIPVFDLPDYLTLPGPLVTYALTLTNYTIYGHSVAKLVWAKISVSELTANLTLEVPLIEVSGNYEMPGLWYNSIGTLSSYLDQVVIMVDLAVDFNDTSVGLYIADLEMDLVEQDLDYNMTGLTFEHQILKDSGAIKLLFRPLFYQMFNVLEPWFLFLINEEVNRLFEKLPEAPFEETSSSKLLNFLRFLIKQMKAEPLLVPNVKEYKKLGTRIRTSNTKLYGLTSLDKIDEMSLEYEDKKLILNLQASASQLLLIFQYNLRNRMLFLNYNKEVKMDIVAPALSTKFEIDLSLAVPPKLLHLEIKTDGLRVRTRGKGFLGPIKIALSDWVDKKRNNVMKLIHKPLTKVIQDTLNNMDIEKSIANMLKKNRKN